MTNEKVCVDFVPDKVHLSGVKPTTKSLINFLVGLLQWRVNILPPPNQNPA